MSYDHSQPSKKPSIFSYPDQVWGPKCNDFDGCSCEIMDRYSIRGYGYERAKVMEIGIAPGKQEEIWGAPLVGPSGERNDSCLRAVKFPRKKVYATNLICWRKDEPTKEEIAECWPRLRAEIERVQPRLIIALGGLACEWLTGYPVGKVRGNLIRPEYNRSEHFAELLGRWGNPTGGLAGSDCLPLPTVLPTWHPAATLRIASLATDVIRDYAKIRPFLAGRLEPLQWDHRVVLDRAEAQAILDSLSGKTVAIDVETETDIADSFGKIICVAMAVREDRGDQEYYTAWVFPVEVLRGLRWPKRVKWLEHNMGYDNPIIKREYGVWLTGVTCTMTMSQCIDERPGRDEDSTQERSRSGEAKKPVGPGFHSLKQLAAEYCLDPSTRVLHSNLKWSKISDVEVGDELIGFEEFSPTPRARRKMKGSIVESKKTVFLKRYRITTDSGEVICSPDHSWLATNFGGNAFRWITAERLKPGYHIAKFCVPWETDTSPEGSYLCGFFDGEGSINGRTHENVGFSQNDGVVAARVNDLLSSKGFALAKNYDERSGCGNYEIRGEHSALRFIGQIRPLRFLANPDVRGMWEGHAAQSTHTKPAKIISIERIEDGELTAIKTSTGTFIAEGLLSHNCGAPPGYGDEMKKFFKFTLEQIAAPKMIPLTEEEIGYEKSLGIIPVDVATKTKRSKPTIPMRLETEEEAATRFRGFLEALYKYNAFDAVNTVALPDRFLKKPCAAFEPYIMPAARAYARVHLTGVPVDVERAKELQQEWEPWIKDLEAELQLEAFEAGYRNRPKLKRDLAAELAYEEEHGEGSWPLGIPADDRKAMTPEARAQAQLNHEKLYGPFSWPGYEPLNLGSSQQLARFLYGTLRIKVKVRSKKTGKPSVGKEAIAEIAHPFVDRMEEVRTATHIKGSHLDPIPELVKGDGRLHPHIWTIGAVNYRRSITDPPMQQYPKEHPKAFWKKLAEVRSVIRPDPGFCFMEADYKQIELHGAARISGDPVFLADLESGDYHTKQVRETFHVDADPSTVVFDHTRRLAKVFNFAVIYLVEEYTLAKTMNEGAAFGAQTRAVTPAEAGRLIRAWYMRNRRYWQWQREMIAEVKKTGRLVNPFGAVRRFPLYDKMLDKQIVNWPISSTCGMHSEISMTELEPIVRRELGGSILFDTHDSLLFHIPIKKRNTARRIIQEVMEEPKIPSWAPLSVEFKYTETSWRDMHDWKEGEDPHGASKRPAALQRGGHHNSHHTARQARDCRPAQVR